VDLGIHGGNAGAVSTPADTARLARAAEQLGYRSWWAPDHVVLPSPRSPASPMDPAEPILDPLVHLGFVAAVTERIELATGIVILPQREPLVLAKQAASLDALSGGRFRLGIGAGYLEPELAAFGVSLAERGARTEEYLDVLDTLWKDEKPEYHGKYVSFANVDAHPRPTAPRVLIGGTSPAAYRRAARRTHGWLGVGNSPAELAEQLAGVRRAIRRADRAEPLETSFLHGSPDISADDIRRYADLGLDELVIHVLPLNDTNATLELMEKHAELLETI